MTNQVIRRPVLLVAGLTATVVLLAAGAVVRWTVTGWSSPFEPDPAADEILGRMTDESDVSTIPSRSGTGAILAVPVAGVTAFWRQTSDGRAPAANQLPYHSFTVPVAVVPATGALLAPIGRGGRFALRPVSGGGYPLCHSAGRTNDRYQVRGCAEATLQPPGRIGASHGEGGFRVTGAGSG